MLLLSDMRGRVSDAKSVPRVAILQHVSQGIIDDGVTGMIAALAEGGFVEPSTISIQRFNAQGDVATSNAIAKQIATGNFDLVLTATTLSLQAVASANTSGRVKHVFGLVSDPVGAGVGVKSLNSLDHPKHLAGLGTLPPVRTTFEIARKLYPQLKTVGVGWNPAESNSRVAVEEGRRVCKELGIELLETTVENSSSAFEAVSSLVSRGAQAIWVGGDVSMITAMDSVVGAAKRGRIPVFTSIPGNVKRGSLFDVGANYTEVGRLAGELAAQVLKGVSPGAIPIRNQMPEKLMFNKAALENLKDSWQIPSELLALSNAMPVAKLNKKWNVQMVQLNNVADVEEAQEGILKGLEGQQLVRGRDFDMTIRNAQGDMATLNTLVDAAIGDGADMLITLSTPTLQAALQRSQGKVPIVFTYVSSAVAAGAGTSLESHLPFVTGVETIGSMDEMVALIKSVVPSARSMGTLFVPAEVNMVYVKDLLAKAAEKGGLRFVATGVATSTEVADAALALSSQGIDVICQVPGNMTAVAFGGIAQAAQRRKIPIFAFQRVQANNGAMVVLARDYLDAGVQTGELAARVMRGESPAKMPFQQMTKSRLILNQKAARALGVTLSPALLSKASEVIQ